MATKKVIKKRIVPKEVLVVHSCTQEAQLKRQEEVLKRISDVTLGNGHPEDGLLFRFRKFMDEHQVVMDDIKDIKIKLSTVAEINAELEINRRVKIELEKKGIIDGEMAHKKKTITWQAIGVLTGIISIIIIAIFSVLNYNINSSTKSDVEVVGSRVEQLGTPVIVNKNGKPVDSRSFEIVMPFKKINDTTTVK